MLYDLVAEPVAASIAYGLGRADGDELILVFDLGGGTLDVSLVESFEGCLEVIATDGDARLGGDDWDRSLMQWVLQQAAWPDERCISPLQILFSCATKGCGHLFARFEATHSTSLVILCQ